MACCEWLTDGLETTDNASMVATGVFDLHCHTTASDGQCSPRELVLRAHAAGVAAVAITDHDSTAGIGEAVAAAAEIGLTAVPGIEIEICEGPGTVHVLGLAIDATSRALVQMVDWLSVERTARNRAIIEALAAAGYTIDAATAQAAHGRRAIAAALVDLGAAHDVADAFDRFIGAGRPQFRDRRTATMADAVNTIHAAGGFAILAHPQTLFVGRTQIAAQIAAWVGVGLDGIEVHHPGLPAGFSRRLFALARDMNIIATGGSDYHGPDRSGRRLGTTHPRGYAITADRLAYLPTILARCGR